MLYLFLYYRIFDFNLNKIENEIRIFHFGQNTQTTMTSQQTSTCFHCKPTKEFSTYKSLKTHRKTKRHQQKLFEDVELTLEKAIEFENQEGYLPEIFLLFFKDENKRVFQNYIQLNKDQGTIEDFLKKPLVFIFANEPECCFRIAKEFLRDPCDLRRHGHRIHPERNHLDVRFVKNCSQHPAI